MRRLCACVEAALGAHAAPALAVAVAVLAGSVLGWVVAFPVISAVAALGAGSLEGGDRALFAPSGMLLAELASSERQTLWAAGATSLVLFPVALGLLAFPTALLFATFGEPARSLRRTIARARDRFAHFVGFGALELSALVAVGVCAWVLLPLLDGFDSHARHASYVVLGLGSVLVLAATSIVLDVARRQSVASGSGFCKNLEYAVQTCKRFGLELAGGYALLTGAAALVTAVVARATTFCAVERDGSWRVVAVFVLHQGVLLTLTLIRTVWIKRVARCTTTTADHLG